VRNANSLRSIEHSVRLEVPYFRPRAFILIDLESRAPIRSDIDLIRISQNKESLKLKLAIPETRFKANPVMTYLMRFMVNFINEKNYIIGNGFLLHPNIVLTTT
jgi:hypothetical protein